MRQMYHGTQYIDELIGLRIADLGRLYVHQDANYNVVALSDMSGRFVERVYYSPYGKPEFVLDAHPFDYDDDGDVDAADIAAATTGGDCWGSYTGQGGDCKRLDADADRDIDADDHTAIVNYVNALPTGGELQRTPSSPRSTLGNAFAHQGLVLDPEIGSYQNRARQYAPRARRFVQRDPANYVDSLNLFSYLDQRPLLLRDASGRCAAPGGCDPSECTPMPPSPPPPPPPPPPPNSCRTDCKQWVEDEKWNNQQFDWLGLLPNCPCSLPGGTGNPDPNVWDMSITGELYFGGYHPGADECIRSKSAFGPYCSGQQCCYKAGALITDGKGVGTPDKVHTGANASAPLTHGAQDVDPYNACDDENQTHLYRQVRPPNNGN